MSDEKNKAPALINIFMGEKNILTSYKYYIHFLPIELKSHHRSHTWPPSKTGGPVHTTTKPHGACVDTESASTCKYWAQLGKCTSSIKALREFMQKKCCATCRGELTVMDGWNIWWFTVIHLPSFLLGGGVSFLPIM